MVDVNNSKWLQGMKEKTAKKKKELMKRDLKITSILFLVGIVAFVVLAVAGASSELAAGCIVLSGIAIFYEIVFLLIRLPISTKALKKEMTKVLVTDELYEQFEKEMMSEPKGLVEIQNSRYRNRRGRVVFTEHFVMSQYEYPGMYRFSSILLWDKMDEMDTTIYKNNGQTNGIVTRFYRTGEKKCCQSIEFKDEKISEAFLTKLFEMKPDIRTRERKRR